MLFFAVRSLRVSSLAVNSIGSVNMYMPQEGAILTLLYWRQETFLLHSLTYAFSLSDLSMSDSI